MPSKKQYNKLKKSPLVAAACVFLIIGAIIGYIFAFNFNKFELASFKVNNIDAENNQSVKINLSALREQLALQLSREPTDAELFKSIILQDFGVNITFLGVSVANTVTSSVYYRKDMTCDVTLTDKIYVYKTGIYYIEYTSSHFAFKNAKLIRTIYVTEA